MPRTDRRWLGALLLAATAAGCGGTTASRGSALAERPGTDPLQRLPEACRAALPSERPMELSEAVALAVCASPRAAALRATLGMRLADVAVAASNGTVELSGSATFDPAMEGFGAELGLPIGRLVTAALRQRVADGASEEARLDAAAALLGLGLEVRLALIHHEQARAEAERFGQLAAIGAAESKAAELLYRAGNIPRATLLRHELRGAEAQSRALDAERRLAAARDAADVAMGLTPGLSAWSVNLPEPSETAGPLDGPDMEQRIVDASLALRGAVAALRSGAESVGLAEASRWSEGLHAGVQVEGAPDAPAWGPLLTVEIPLGAERQAQVDREARRFDRLLAEREAAVVAVRADARRAMAELRVAAALVRQDREKILPLQQQSLAEAVLRYNAMELGVFDLLAQRTALGEAELAAVGRLGRYRAAAAQWEHLLAGGAAVPPQPQPTTGASPVAPASSHGE